MTNQYSYFIQNSLSIKLEPIFIYDTDYISMTGANIQKCMEFYEYLEIHVKHSGISLSPIGPYDGLYLV